MRETEYISLHHSASDKIEKIYYVNGKQYTPTEYLEHLKKHCFIKDELWEFIFKLFGM